MSSVFTMSAMQWSLGGDIPGWNRFTNMPGVTAGTGSGGCGISIDIGECLRAVRSTDSDMCPKLVTNNSYIGLFGLSDQYHEPSFIAYDRHRASGNGVVIQAEMKKEGYTV
jgi:hypothetical protein